MSINTYTGRLKSGTLHKNGTNKNVPFTIVTDADSSAMVLTLFINDTPLVLKGSFTTSASHSLLGCIKDDRGNKIIWSAQSTKNILHGSYKALNDFGQFQMIKTAHKECGNFNTVQQKTQITAYAHSGLHNKFNNN